MPKSEIALKPIWQQAGLIGETLTANFAPSAPKRYADEKLQRKVIDTLADFDCYVGAGIASRLNLIEGSHLTIIEQEFTIKKYCQKPALWTMTVYLQIYIQFRHY